MSRILKRVAREPGVLAESDRWRTPPPLFMALYDEFGFSIDLAATRDDRMLEDWLGPGSDLGEDALKVVWGGLYAATAPALPWGFLNPPYSAQLIKQFMENVVEQTRTAFAAAVLLPDTHDTQWYRHLRWASEIRRIPHRVPYLKADGSTKAGAMFPSCVAIFRPQPGVRNPQPRVVEWTWRQE